MPYKTLFLDLDDTLYSRSSGLWPELKKRISSYLHECMNFPIEEVPATRQRLMSTYGTTLRGLKVEYGVDEHHFLQYVHEVDLRQFIQPDPELAALLSSYAMSKIIFTSADRNHANRVINILGLEGLFDQIIDVMDVWPNSKPQPEAFLQALEMTGKEAGSSVFIDDHAANVLTAQQLGFYAILIGDESPGLGIRHLPRLHLLPTIMSVDGQLLQGA